MNNSEKLLQPILQFLNGETPDSWIDEAKKPEHLQLLLTDHMVCELNVNMCKLSFNK